MPHFRITAALAVLAAAAALAATLHRSAPSTGTMPTPLQPSASPALQPTDPSIEWLSRTEFDGRDLQIGRVLESNDTYAKRYVTYMSGDLLISGTFSIPHGDGPFPLVVLNHGYIDPAVYTNGRGLRREQDYLARRGYAVLHTDYRGHAQSSADPNGELRFRLGYAEDSVNAVHAVRAAKLPNVDAERVAMLGHSMGGGVTLQAITAVPGLLDAAVLFAPVSGDARDNFARWTRTRAEVAAQIVATHGFPEDNPDFWDGVSPVAHLDRVQTPVLLHHGTADESCPVEWARELDAAFTDAGREITYYEYPGEPHEFAAAWPTVMARTVEFLDVRLKR